MEARATGGFTVKLSPLETAVTGLGRLSIDKRFEGDLDATSAGEMLSVGTEVEGSAGYVAIERVVGTLAGREGTFALQHTGTMNRGTPELEVTVVPDSGTGALTGLTGSLAILRGDGGHRYEFDYALP